MLKNILTQMVLALAIGAGTLVFAEGLDSNMETMNKSFRVLKRQIGSPEQKVSNLELIGKMKDAAVACKNGVPEKVESVPQAERAKFLQDFQEMIGELVVEIEKLEKAVQQGRIQDAQKALDDINELKRDGHSIFAGSKEKR